MGTKLYLSLIVVQIFIVWYLNLHLHVLIVDPFQKKKNLVNIVSFIQSLFQILRILSTLIDGGGEESIETQWPA